MSPINNKAIYLRFAKAVNERNLNALDALVASDWLNHGAEPDEPAGAERFKRIFSDLIAACPDFQIVVEDQVAEDDKVVVRWTDTGTHTGAPLFGIEPTGKQFLLTGIDILRIFDDQIVERWSESDMLYLLRSLEVLP